MSPRAPLAREALRWGFRPRPPSLVRARNGSEACKIYGILYISSVNVFTATEAARMLGRSLALVARYCREGRLPGSQRKGRCWLIPDESLERFRASLARYRRGRPRRPSPSIFWRETSVPSEEARARILATRDPSSLPRWVGRRAAVAFARAGRTLLEKRVRSAMVEALYARRA